MLNNIYSTCVVVLCVIILFYQLVIDLITFFIINSSLCIVCIVLRQ